MTNSLIGRASGLVTARVVKQYARENAFLPLCSVEQLESRTLLAGDVVAAVVNGDLLVSGDRSDNNVELAAQDGNMVLIGMADTTVNGASDAFVVVEGSSEFNGRVVA